MNSLFVVGSPWHAVLARAISKKGDSVILEQTSAVSAEAIIKELDNSGLEVIVSVKWDDFSLKRVGFKRAFFNPFCIFNALRKLRKLIPRMSYENLYVFNVNSPSTRLIMKYAEVESVIKVEDGVCDYLPFPLLAEHGLLKTILRGFFVRLNRASEFYLAPKALGYDRSLFFFPEKARKFVNQQSLLSYKKQLLSVLSDDSKDIDLDLSNSCAGLIIGQTLCEDGYCDLDDEVDLYKRCAIAIYQSGVPSVLIKLHPRTSAEKLSLILGSMSELKYVSVSNGSYPVERLLVRGCFKVVVGMWSNPIILARPLFDIESFTIMPLIALASGDPLLCKIDDFLKDNFEDDYVTLGVMK